MFSFFRNTHWAHLSLISNNDLSHEYLHWPSLTQLRAVLTVLFQCLIIHLIFWSSFHIFKSCHLLVLVWPHPWNLKSLLKFYVAIEVELAPFFQRYPLWSQIHCSKLQAPKLWSREPYFLLLSHEAPFI